MSDLAKVLAQLRQERNRVKNQLLQLDQAIRALSKVGIRSGKTDVDGGSVRTRTISAAARKRIAAAQKARWAKFRAAKGRAA